jgi:hypothetical protein
MSTDSGLQPGDPGYASRNVPAEFDASRLEPLDPVRLEIMRRLTTAERLAIAFDLNRFARERIAHDLRAQHPEWDDVAIQKEVARRFLRGST